MKSKAEMRTKKLIEKKKEQIKKFAEYCATKLPIEKPSSKDCWDCSWYQIAKRNTWQYMEGRNIQVKEEVRGHSMGDVFENITHLEMHIKEKYVVPSLLFNALHENHAPLVYIWYIFREDVTTDENAVKKFLKRSIIKYLNKRIIQKMRKNKGEVKCQK